MVCRGLLPISVYLDSSSVEGGWIASATQQKKDSIEKVSRAVDRGELSEVEKVLDNFFGVLFVQIKGARNLPNMDEGMFSSAGNLTDAFVILRLGNKECGRTSTIKDNLNPIWDQDFRVDPPVDVDSFRLEVADNDTDEWAGNDVEQIGFVQVDFRKTPGEWNECQETLRHHKTGKEMNKCHLTFRYFFATSMRHLMEIFDAIPVPPSFTRDDFTSSWS